MPDQYDQWRQMLAGEQVAILAEKPIAGFYKTRKAPGPWLPVAIWQDGDEIVAQKGVKDVEASSVWPWCAKTPISHDLYQAALKDSTVLAEPISASAPAAAPVERMSEDDDIPTDQPLISTGEERVEPETDRLAIGGNNPPDEMMMTKEEIEADLAKARVLVKAGAAKSDEAEAAGNALIERLKGFEKKVFSHRRELKKPFEEEIKAIDGLWMPLEKSLQMAVSTIKSNVVGPYLTAKREADERKRREAAEAAREEARRAQDAAKATASEDAAIEAQKAAEQAEAAERQASAKSTVSSGKGTTKAREVRRAKIDDPVALATWLVTRPQPNADVMAALQTAADRMVVAKADQVLDGGIPGVSVYTETRYV